MIKIGISMIKNWYSNYFYFYDQHFKKPMVPFVPWSLLAMVPFGHGPFWVLVPFWLVQFHQYTISAPMEPWGSIFQYGFLVGVN